MCPCTVCVSTTLSSYRLFFLSILVAVVILLSTLCYVFVSLCYWLTFFCSVYVLESISISDVVDLNCVCLSDFLYIDQLRSCIVYGIVILSVFTPSLISFAFFLYPYTISMLYYSILCLFITNSVYVYSFFLAVLVGQVTYPI